MPPTTHSPSHQTALLERLQQSLGSHAVLTGEALTLRHTRDWSEAPSTPPLALLLPQRTEEVALALKLCHEAHCPVVVQGGLTGLAGGANPQRGEIALSLARMNRIERIDSLAGTVQVQAGVTLEQLQDAVQAEGWMFPLDLGARGSCQLGGNAATNAGGNRVLRYGMMRNLVLGLEVVLPDGTLLCMMDEVLKNNAGFDLKQLFIGSEGTLGVITRLSLMLAPLQRQQCTALCGVPSFTAARQLLRLAKARLPELSAFEVMWDRYWQASLRARNHPSPLQQAHPLYVLLETSAQRSASSAITLESVLEEALEQGWASDAIIAQTGSQQAQLWAIREGVGELLSEHHPCAAFDVSVALADMEALVQQLEPQLQEAFPHQHHLLFGHLGDGNLHLISGPYPEPGDLARAEALVYRAVGAFQGSISAEHGIGVIKRPFLHHSRSQPEMALMRTLKQAIDPKGILNPGRVLPVQATA